MSRVPMPPLPVRRTDALYLTMQPATGPGAETST